MDLRRPLTCESAGTTGRRRTPAAQPRTTARRPDPQASNCPQMMTRPRPATTRPGTFRAVGCNPLQRGTSHAYGDRASVPDDVERPRPRRHAPLRAECPRPALCQRHDDRPHASRTHLRTEDVPFPQTTTVKPQWSAGRRSPRGGSTSPTRSSTPDHHQRPINKTVSLGYST